MATNNQLLQQIAGADTEGLTNNQLLQVIADNGGGGGGGSTTASNGLTKTGDEIKLGGEITETTQITGTEDKVVAIAIGSAGVTPVSGVVVTGASLGLQHYDPSATIVSGVSLTDDGAQLSVGSNGIQLSSQNTIIHLFSPNGTKYKLVVGDDGTLSTEVA